MSSELARHLYQQATRRGKEKGSGVYVQPLEKQPHDPNKIWCSVMLLGNQMLQQVIK